MSNYLNIPRCSPFRFLPVTGTAGINFDSDWAYNLIKSFETKTYYYQKWQRGDSTPLQISCTILPGNIQVYDCNKKVVKTISFTPVAVAGTLGFTVYEAIINLDSLPDDGVYYLYIKAELLSVLFEAISEPIYLKSVHDNTLLFTYRNSFNDFGVYFTTGIQYNFRCEAGVMDFQPERERFSYVDQIHNITTLSSTPFRKYKLYIGDAKGVSPYILDILNRIFSCDFVSIGDLQYETTEGSQFEVNRVKGYPLYGASIEVTEARNLSSLQLNTESPITPGIVTAYGIETDFFGDGADIYITEVESIN